MAIDNSSIKVTIRDSTGTFVVGATVTFNVAGLIITSISDESGLAVATLPLTTLTALSLTINASGFVSQTVNNLIGVGENDIAVLMPVDPTQIYRLLYIVDPSNSPLANAKVFVQGYFVGYTDNNGSIYVQTPAGTKQVVISLSGYTTISLVGNYTNSNFPTRLTMYPTIPVASVITIYSIPGAAIIIGNTSGDVASLTDDSGFAIISAHLNPGIYRLTVLCAGYKPLNSILKIIDGVSYYSAGILEVDNEY